MSSVAPLHSDRLRLQMFTGFLFAFRLFHFKRFSSYLIYYVFYVSGSRPSLSRLEICKNLQISALGWKWKMKSVFILFGLGKAKTWLFSPFCHKIGDKGLKWYDIDLTDCLYPISGGDEMRWEERPIAIKIWVGTVIGDNYWKDWRVATTKANQYNANRYRLWWRRWWCWCWWRWRW